MRVQIATTQGRCSSWVWQTSMMSTKNGGLRVGLLIGIQGEGAVERGSYNAEQWGRAKQASGAAWANSGGKLMINPERLWVMNQEKQKGATLWGVWNTVLEIYSQSSGKPLMFWGGNFLKLTRVLEK